jgi:hypothetical protein
VDGGVVDGGEVDGGVLDGGEVDGGVLDGGEVDRRVLDGGEADGKDVGGGVVDGGVKAGGVVADGVVADSSGEALAVCESRAERVGCGSPGSLYHVAPALCAGGSPWLSTSLVHVGAPPPLPTPLPSSVPAAGATLFLEERRLGRWRRTARAARRTLR